MSINDDRDMVEGYKEGLRSDKELMDSTSYIHANELFNTKTQDTVCLGFTDEEKKIMSVFNNRHELIIDIADTFFRNKNFGMIATYLDILSNKEYRKYGYEKDIDRAISYVFKFLADSFNQFDYTNYMRLKSEPDLVFQIQHYTDLMKYKYYQITSYNGNEDSESYRIDLKEFDFSISQVKKVLPSAFFNIKSNKITMEKKFELEDKNFFDCIEFIDAINKLSNGG